MLNLPSIIDTTSIWVQYMLKYFELCLNIVKKH